MEIPWPFSMPWWYGSHAAALITVLYGKLIKANHKTSARAQNALQNIQAPNPNSTQIDKHAHQITSMHKPIIIITWLQIAYLRSMKSLWNHQQKTQRVSQTSLSFEISLRSNGSWEQSTMYILFPIKLFTSNKLKSLMDWKWQFKLLI